MKVLTLARKAIRRTWMNYALRGVSGADNHGRLELAYRIADPWNMESELERFRFERTNALISKYFPDVRSILEVGCGEGHQSEYLLQVCDNLYGIDVSETAIDRARQRVPSAQFAVADIFSHPWGDEAGRFDLVVACEVLYYIADIEATVNEMSRVGNACLATIYAPAIRRVGRFLEDRPGVGKDWFGSTGAEWVVAYWRTDSDCGK